MSEIEIEKWEHELDMLGVFASIEALEEHLSKAPLNAPSVSAVSDYICVAKFAAKRLKAEAIGA